MKKIRSNVLILSLLSSSLLLMSCQNESPRLVKAQLGTAGATNLTTAAKESFDEALGSDRSVPCVEGFEKNYVDLKLKNFAANKILIDNTGNELDAASKADLTKKSAELVNLTDVLVADMIKQKASSCTTGDSKDSQDLNKYILADIKIKIDQTVIAIADKLKIDDVNTKKIREEKAKLDQIRFKKSLVGMTFQITSKLSDVFDKAHLSGEAHFTSGIIGLGLTDYQLVLKDKTKTVCGIKQAFDEKISVETKLMILNVAVETNEEVDPDNESSVVKRSDLVINLSAKEHIYILQCRLSENMRSSTKEDEFKNAFKDLIKFQN